MEPLIVLITDERSEEIDEANGIHRAPEPFKRKRRTIKLKRTRGLKKGR